MPPESTDVESIKHLIEHLPTEQQTALAAWIAERDSEAWANQIERDFSAGGAGLALLEEIDAQIDSGDFQPFKVIRPRG